MLIMVRIPDIFQALSQGLHFKLSLKKYEITKTWKQNKDAEY